MFLEDVPQAMVAIRAALDAGDAEHLTAAVHTFKGAAAAVAATAIMDAAQRLEDLGQAGTLATARPVFAHLEQVVADTLEALRAVGRRGPHEVEST